MAWSAPRTWTATTLAAADLNQDVRDNETWLKAALTTSGITSDTAISKVKSAQCGVRCTSSTDQSIVTATDSTLTWNSEDYDTDGFHSTSSNTHRITIPAGLDGTYIVSVSIRFDNNATGDRLLWIENDAGTIQLRDIRKAAANTFTQITLTGIVVLAAAGWVAAHCQQDSGSTLTALKSVPMTFFSAHRLFAA